MMLSDVCRVYIWSAGGVCSRPAGWRVLVDRARLGRPGSRLPLRASVAGLGGGISWRLPAYSLLTKVVCSVTSVYHQVISVHRQVEHQQLEGAAAVDSSKAVTVIVTRVFALRPLQIHTRHATARDKICTLAYSVDDRMH